MQPGFDITFHGVIPDTNIFELVRARLARLGGHPGLHCSVVLCDSAVEHAYDAHVELTALFPGVSLCGDALAPNPRDAVLGAFAELERWLVVH